MRLLALGHSYVTAFAQAKYVAMKALAPHLALRIVVPSAVSHVFGRYEATRAAGLAPADLVVLRSLRGRSHMTYTLDPVGLSRMLRAFDPTHIHIEEDPHAAVAVELLWLARRVAPHARVSFFLWDNVNRHRRFPAGPLKRRLVRCGLARAALVLCGNRDAQGLLAAKGYSGPSRVVPQIGLERPVAAADNVRLIRESVTRGRHDAVVIGFVGRLVPEKGVLLLLEAFHQLSADDRYLLVVGDGPLRAMIERDWKTRLGERLTLLDPVPHHAVHEYLTALDIFVLPSYATRCWKEQFGLTLAHAMLCGVACIGSRSGAIGDVLDGAGLLVSEGDIDGLAAALRRLIADVPLRLRLGRAGRAVAMRRYTAEAVAAAHLEAFDSVA